MEWVERLNQSMQYIEEHLTGEPDYEQLARIACCSTYHYQEENVPGGGGPPGRGGTDR